MSKQRIVITDDQVLVDKDFIFNAIREEKGDWEKVEKEMDELLSTVQGMTGDEE